MQKCFILVSVFLYALSSCKKSHSDPVYFQLQLNNTLYTFDSVQTDIDTSNNIILVMHAFNTKTQSNVSLAVMTDAPNNFVGAYSNQAGSARMIYGMTTAIISGSGASEHIVAYNISVGLPFSFTITQLNSNMIQGVFSGTVVQNLPSQDIPLTNGRFSVLR